nr:MAG TPA: hypothetical protein [Caudoviricetes sp.]
MCVPFHNFSPLTNRIIKNNEKNYAGKEKINHCYIPLIV